MSEVLQGAIQLQITINGQSITVEKQNAVSLSIKRVIGDSANEFTLEAFDETAWQLESVLMADKTGKATKTFAPISVTYSAANDLTKSLSFSGTCYNYQTTFVGSATMLSITGVLAASDVQADGWWFDTRSIQWVDTNAENRDGIWYVDGKSQSEYENYKNNKDVCAILDFANSDGTTKEQPTVYINPTRVFERIIHKYNGDKLGSTTGSSVTYNKYAGPSLVSGSTVTDTIHNFFKKKGFTEIAIAGIMGNMQQENSFKTNENSGGLGIFQYTGGRKKACLDYLNQRGYDPWSLIGQLNFMNDVDAERQFFSFTGSNFPKYYKDTGAAYGWNESMSWKDFKNYKGSMSNGVPNLYESIRTAAQIFSQVFERPGIPMLEKRKAYAVSWYNHFNAEKVTSTTTAGMVPNWGTGGSGKFKIAEAEESRWVAGVNCVQGKGQTAAQFITNTLCKVAVTNKHSDYKDETAGYKYWVDVKGHHFMPIEYKNTKSKITLTYGMKNSTVISFAINEVGVMAMLGSSVDADGNSLVSSSALDNLNGDVITVEGENIKDSGYIADSEKVQKSAENINWYFSNVKSIFVDSSATPTGLSRKLASTWSDLEKLSISANLTVWASYSKIYSPGDFIDIVIVGPTGQRHYASGTYMILNITDNISSDGYTQAMDLLKLADTGTSSTPSGSYIDSGITDANGNLISGDTSSGKSTTTVGPSHINISPGFNNGLTRNQPTLRDSDIIITPDSDLGKRVDEITKILDGFDKK